MAYELIYTSAPSGLAQGSSGFCIVACTKGMNLRLTRQLEAMSAYKPLYPHYADNAWDNPVSHAYCTFDGNGVRQHILSRICFNGVDYTGRSNKLASHLVLSGQEAATAAGGPASLFLCDGLFKDASWEIKTEQFFQQLPIPATQASSVKCNTWEQITGDAGWGGFLAQSYLDNPGKRVYISYAPHQHASMIYLIQEALNLLPEDKRWEVSFNTYFVTLPAGVNCSWRCCPADSEAMLSARRSPLNIVIDLNAPGELTTSSPLIDAARSGIMQQQQQAPVQQVVPDDFTEIRLKPPVTQSTPPMQYSQVVIDDTIMLPQPPPRQLNSKFNVKILFILIPVFFLIIAAAAGITIYNYRKNQQLYTEGNSRCLQFQSAIDELSSQSSKYIAKARTASTGKECEELSKKINSLLEEVKYIREQLKNLSCYNKVFSSRAPEVQPGTLDKNCTALISDLEKTLGELTAKAAFLPKTKPEKKKAEVKKEKKKTPPPAPKAEPGKKKKTPPAKAVPAAPKIVAENYHFLWEKPLSLLRKNANISITLGDDVKAADIQLIIDGSTANVGEDLTCDDGNGRDAIITSKFADGKLTISAKKFAPAPGQKMSIKIKNKIYPMYFQLEKSLLVPPAKNKDNIVSSSGNGVTVTLDISVPAEIYDQNNNLLKDSAVKYIISIGDDTYELKPNGKNYTAGIKLPKLAKLRRNKRALSKLEDDLVFILGRKAALLKRAFPKNEEINKFISSYKEISRNIKAKKIIDKNLDLKKNAPVEDVYRAAKQSSFCTTNSVVSSWLQDVEKFIELGEELISKIRSDKKFTLKEILTKENSKKYYQNFADSPRTLDGESAFIDDEIKNVISDFKKQEFVLHLSVGDVKYKQYVISDKPRSKK